MKPMWKGIRAFLWSLACLAAVGAIALYLGAKPAPPPYADGGLSDAMGDMGGPFAMQDAKGRPFTEKNLNGKPTAMFFGFTACPDVCPTTLADMNRWLEKLGPAADRINMVFVSVDAERDTPEQMAHYLSMFDARIIGITGSPQQLADMAKAYRIYYKKVPVEAGNYTMDHTASIYLLNGQQRLVGTIAYRENDAIAFQKLQRLAN